MMKENSNDIENNVLFEQLSEAPIEKKHSKVFIFTNEKDSLKRLHELEDNQIKPKTQNEEHREAFDIAEMETVPHDFTTLNQTVEVHRNSEAENRIIIDVNPDILFRINKQGFIIDYHAPANTQFYVTPEVFLGKTIVEVMPPVVAKKIMETIETACHTNQMAIVEYELIKDEKHTCFENRIFPINANELFSFVRDITERKKVEAEQNSNYSLLRMAGKTVSFGGWSLDLIEKKVKWSDEVANIHGKPKGYSPTLVEGISFYAPEWIDKFTKVVTDCIVKGIPYDEELEIINACGKRIWVRSNGEAIHDNFGNVVKIQGSFQDISKKKMAEQKLSESESHLKELNATKDKFFSIIAHDLQSPFQSIVGFSNLLAQDIQDKNYADAEIFAGIIQNSSIQAMDLLMNLMQWSRSQSGRMEFTPEKVAITEMVHEATRFLNDSAKHKSITIYTKLPAKLMLIADKAMFGTILRNLISNAIKFTNPKGEIVVSAVQQKNKVLVSVADNGVGMSSERILKLFRIDQNHSAIGTQNEQGTGLGLILCKEFVEKHGGKIWAESDAGKGSTFFFTIPGLSSRHFRG